MKRIICSVFFLVLVGYLLFPGLTRAAIPAAERQALIALYNSTNGDSWHNNSGWKTPPLDADGFAMPGTEDSWYGVLISSETVSDISLASNNLVGTLPVELGNFTNLRYLWLNNNQLSESIPPELGNITYLWDLNLDSNQLSGSIPPELGNLTSLLALNLDSNQLSGSIPPELGNLTYLLGLYLDSNQLSGSIPPELGNLTDLLALVLDSNQLSGSIPLQLMNLTKLSDNGSDFRFNHLFTTNDDLRNFLNSKQIGGDWESYQTPPFTRAMPWIPLLLLDD